MKLAMWTGIIQKASISEIVNAMVTTKGITNKNLPRIPGNSMSGKNAAMVVATEATTGVATSETPSMHACMVSCPRCMR